MNKIIIIFLSPFVLCFCSSHAGKKTYLVCDDLSGADHSPNRPYDGVYHYFDRVLYYEKTNEESYKVHFTLGNSMGTQLNGDVLSKAYLQGARDQSGIDGKLFYREMFRIYQFDIKTRILTAFYLYHVSPEDYSKNLKNNPLLSTDDPVFTLIEKEMPENYIKVTLGRNQVRWQCYEISYFKYLFFILHEILYGFTA